MEFAEALTKAMTDAGLRDEEVATKAHVSFYTVQNIRLGRVKEPRRVIAEALKREVPGLAALLDSNDVSVA